MEREKARRLASVIATRHSTRKYGGPPIDPAVMDRLAQVALEVEPVDGVHARVELVQGAAAAGGLFRGIAGAYGKVTGCPAAMVLVADTSRPGHLEAVGYYGEQVILEATSLGVSTCWVSGFFKRDVARQAVALGDNEEVIAVSPLGYPAPGIGRIHDASMKMIQPLQGGRKPLSAIVRGSTLRIHEGGREGIPVWLHSALEAARLAPSARNRQPWVFESRDDGTVALFAAVGADFRPIGLRDHKRLDCGIAMLHFEVAALASGVEGAWTLGLGEEQPVAVFRSASQEPGATTVPL
ncbi:MAG: hypothetical protein HPY55_04590 [Firmicutes bacterium]|nr:hypothetical protein [Bacillota bacterium]